MKTDKIVWDIAGISKVRRRRERLQTIESDQIFYNFGEEQILVRGIGFLVNKRQVEYIIHMKAIRTRPVYDS